MNDPRPAFMFHVADFWTAEAVESMTFEAAGLYVFLLGRQWQTGSLPDDASVLRRLCGWRASAFTRAWPMVAHCFPIGTDGKRRNARLERVRADADEKSGKAGDAARKRWEKWRAEHPQNGRDASAMRPHSERTANAMQGENREGREVQPSAGAAASPPTRPPPSKPRIRDPEKAAEKAEASEAKRVPDHVRVVETFVQAWAFYRHELDKSATNGWTFEKPDGIPPDKRYVMHERDWVAAARLWRNVPDIAAIRKRMCCMFESTAKWVQDAASLALLDSKWNQFDRKIVQDGDAA